ncbi:unnamed protein product, partial [Nippostrongylus brasiliensis]|uniref:Integrase catalytic domain-containing protein n=1 Tax=Nippostrongylus brasiliensis TaxID=27835 RepID=A0A0N4XRR5_NIPBR
MAQMEDPPTDDLSKQLALYKCEELQLLRVRTRIKNAALPMETTHPVLLPRNSYITSLFVIHVHEKNFHTGTEQTLVELRKSIWIPKGRTTVKKIINKLCFVCKKTKAKPYKLPNFPDLPLTRVKRPNYPFEHCGMDTLGPMRYRNENQTTEKCWILLWTCLSCRAIVVDIMRDMSSRTFLHSLRQFIATNGCPKTIVSDNASTFHAFSTAQTTEAIDSQEPVDVIDYCAKHQIQFKFIPAFSPWQGGVYERMIRIFKSAFKTAIGNRILPLTTLQTLAKESEAICNSRPLTYVADQTDHIPLRPIDFIRPTSRLSYPRFIEDSDNWKPKYSTRDELIKEWKFGINLLDQFWSRWSKEYLTSLKERYKLSHPHPRCYQRDQPSPNFGDYVLVQE